MVEELHLLVFYKLPGLRLFTIVQPLLRLLLLFNILKPTLVGYDPFIGGRQVWFSCMSFVCISPVGLKNPANLGLRVWFWLYPPLLALVIPYLGTKLVIGQSKLRAYRMLFLDHLWSYYVEVLVWDNPLLGFIVYTLLYCLFLLPYLCCTF
uniref:Cytochrome b6 n=1 Tax=Chenopodium album TaxID=3559 RepID=A0A291S811_CHEAL|nr:cytochrome b6 [Chenopodium album]